MQLWQPNSPLNGLAHIKNDHYRRESSWETGKHPHHGQLPPVEERLPRCWPEHGLRDE